jgi:Double-GTPase 2
MVSLRKGTALDAAGAYTICRSGDAITIAIAGPVKSGKTTLISSIHQGFLFGPVKELKFKRSHTLVGFEEKCFNSRVESGADTPSTPRTSYSAGVEYYHLRVKDSKTSSSPHLVLLDMSGEYFDRAINSRQDALQLQCLRAVDFVSFLLDGAKLADATTIQKVYSDATLLLRRLLEEKIISRDSRVQMLVTKIDMMCKEPKTSEVEKVVEEVARRFERFGDQLHLEFRAVAASPAVGSAFPQRFGIPDLLKIWTENEKKVPTRPGPLLIRSSRLIDRLPAVWLRDKYALVGGEK